MTTTPLSQEHLDLAVIRMREHGANIGTGGSRCNTTWGYSAPDGWYRDEFDEGWQQRFPATEQEARAQLNALPDQARALLYQAERAVAVAAMLRDDHPAATIALDAATADARASEEDQLLRALINAEPLDDAQRAALRALIEGQTLWHLIMGATAWEQSVTNGLRGLRMLDRALSIIGPPPPRYADDLRARFAEMAGDLSAALALLEATLLRPARYDDEHHYTHKRIAALRAKLAT
jgi:hypothetical protein